MWWVRACTLVDNLHQEVNSPDHTDLCLLGSNSHAARDASANWCVRFEGFSGAFVHLKSGHDASYEQDSS